MISSGTGVRVYLAFGATDMRNYVAKMIMLSELLISRYYLFLTSNYRQICTHFLHLRHALPQWPHIVEREKMDAEGYGRRCLDPGSLLPWTDQFAAELVARRYTQLPIDGYTASARHFGVRLESAGILINDVDDAVVLRFF